MRKQFKFLFVTSGSLISIFAGIIFVAAMIEAIRENFVSDIDKIGFGFLLWTTFVLAIGGLFGTLIAFKEDKYNLSLVIGSIYLLVIILILSTNAVILSEKWLYSLHIFLAFFSITLLVLGLLLTWLKIRNSKIAVVRKGKLNGK